MVSPRLALVAHDPVVLMAQDLGNGGHAQLDLLALTPDRPVVRPEQQAHRLEVARIGRLEETLHGEHRHEAGHLTRRIRHRPGGADAESEHRQGGSRAGRSAEGRLDHGKIPDAGSQDDRHASCQKAATPVNASQADRGSTRRRLLAYAPVAPGGARPRPRTPAPRRRPRHRLVRCSLRACRPRAAAWPGDPGDGAGSLA